MVKHDNIGAFGVLTEPATLKIERMLPGPIERVWAYLTESDKRRQWLASGDMELKVGAPFQLTWRNDELSSPPGKRPEGFSDCHSMDSRVTEVDPPRKLSFTWGKSGAVSFELEPRGRKVLLTVIHQRLSDRANTLNVGAGWHSHLDVLVAVLSGVEPAPFWDAWTSLRAEYDKRVP